MARKILASSLGETMAFMTMDEDMGKERVSQAT
jgi:hypothetical protein